MENWIASRGRKGLRLHISKPNWGSFAKVVVRMYYATEDSKEGLSNARIILAAPKMKAALEALGAMPDGFCFCSKNRSGSKPEAEHEPECRDARIALYEAEHREIPE